MVPPETNMDRDHVGNWIDAAGNCSTIPIPAPPPTKLV